MKKQSKALLTAVLLTVLALAFTFAVKVVDVQPIGPLGTKVGFAGLNGTVATAIGTDENGFTYNERLYSITGVIGIASFIWLGVLGIIGLVQWIRRKHLLRVDAEILAMGIVCVLTLLLYIFFDKVAVNYRPVMMPGETAPESSFPSSHTMLAIILWVGAAAVLPRYIKSKPVIILMRALFPAVACAECLMRALSGVHWATDILAALIYCAALFGWYGYLRHVIRKLQVKALRARG